MIGWINLSVEAFICDSFGRDAWVKIIKAAHVETNWVSSCPYPDKITYDLVITGAGILGVSVPQALEAYGQYFVNYVIKQGYTRLLKSLGSNIAEFLANLNNLHLHLTMGFPSMVAPAFRVDEVTSTSLLLHYYSIRPALSPIVSGVLKGISKFFFNHEVEMELIASRDAGDCDHEIFRVKYPHQESLDHWDDHEAALASEYGLTKDFFYEMFPFHIILDTECRVVQAGRLMSRLFGKTLVRGSVITDTFKLRHPYIPFEFERMVLETDSLYLLKALQTGLEFKGQMVKTSMPDGRTVLLFLGSPRVANLEEMELHGLYLSDIPLHDMSRDFVLLAEQRQAEADLKERFETMAVELRLANERLEQATRWLDEERQRSDALLYRMLPADIAADLREGRKVEAINYPEVTILFSDMVGFTTTSAKSTAEEVYNMLNEMYDKFDSLVDEFPDVYKLETIGDAYFLVCNLTTDCDDHVDVVIDFAIRMQALARHVKNAQGEPVQIRIGIHTGPVVGGVLGAKTPRFSVYGDTVNVASRMESHGLPGKIHISAASYSRIVAKAKYAVRERGNIAVKGRGNMTTYLIGGIKDDWLLRHNSFDAQIDGGGPATRDGSFVITASGRSLESMGNNRLSSAMESITEGDEDRGSKTYNLATSSQSTDVGPATSAAPPSAASTSTGSTQQFAPVSFGSQTASVAVGRASEPGVITAGNSDGANTGVSQVRSTTVMDGLINANLAAAFSIAGGGGGAPLTSLGSGGSFVAGGCGSFRETVSRDTSFRAVYARGGRQSGNASSIISNGSRIALVNGGLVPVSSLVHLAARSDFASDSDAGSASGLGNAGGSGGIALECPMNSLSRRAGTDSSQHGNEANVGSAGSYPGSMGAVGVPGGFVMARNATYKAPLPGQSPASVTGGAAAAPSAGTASRTSAEAVGSPRGSLRQQLNQPDSPFGVAAALVGAAGVPTQAAVLQQLRETPSEDLGPRASSSASSRTQSEMGADGQALPSGKSKGLTSKLKNWFKK